MPIYLKGQDQMGLAKAAIEQRAAEMTSIRGMSPEEYKEYNYNTGKTGAERIATAGPSTDLRTAEIGPVSGAHLAKFRKMMVEGKKTKEREMKRR